MEVLLIICVGLLAGNARAQLTLSVNATPTTTGQKQYFSPTLKCDPDRLVYVVSVQYEYSRQLCTCLGRPAVVCSPYLSPSELDFVTAMCWTTSTCIVSFSKQSVNCTNKNYPSLGAYFTYFCADATPTLTIEQVGSGTGTSLTAGYPPSEPTFSPANASWECSVEAWDCSRVNVTLLLFIRNGNNTFSYFTVSGFADRVGGPSAYSHAQAFVLTPFKIFLNVVEGSLIQNAYIAVHAQQNLSLVCGNAGFPTQPVESQCAACQSNPCPTEATCVPSPVSIQCVCPDGFFYSTDGLSCMDVDECKTIPRVCDVTARCNNTEGGVHCYCDPGYSLTDNGRGCTDIDECATAPSACDVTAHCSNTEGCFHCYCDPGYSLTSGGSCQDINECDKGSTACDVTAHCNNTVGSFHCYCDPGNNLTDNGRGCLGPPITEPQSLVSVLYPAVGGAVGGVVVIAVVVVIVIVVVLRSRNRKTVSESEASLEFDRAVYVNNAYEDPSQSGDNHIMVNYETPVTHPEDQLYTNTGTPASAVTSEDTQDYDVLGQTRPAAAAKSDVIYSHIQLNGFQPDDVEYSYDRAGEKPRRKVITGANYETPNFKSPEDEGNEDDAQYDYNSTAKTASAGVMTDAVYHALQPVSSAGEPVQDSANNSESQVTPAPQQPGAVAVDLDDGPIYTNSGQ